MRIIQQETGSSWTSCTSVRYAKKSLERENAIEEAAEELADEFEEMELDDDGIQLEDDEALRAAEPDVVGENVNITQAPREMQLEGQKASSDEAAEEQQARSKSFV